MVYVMLATYSAHGLMKKIGAARRLGWELVGSHNLAVAIDAEGIFHEFWSQMIAKSLSIYATDEFQKKRESDEAIRMLEYEITRHGNE